ncbi:MAG: STAS domain-containing protein, partial [Thermomicrobiales bacterium]
TLIGTVVTKNLAIGVAVGVIFNGLFFAWELARSVQVSSEIDVLNNERTYMVSGQIFFASTDRFIDAFDYHEQVAHLTLDMRHAHFWDTSAIAALDRVVMKLRGAGAVVEVTGMNPRSASMVDRLAAHDPSDTNVVSRALK